MKKIIFVTGNKRKFETANNVLNKFGINLTQRDMDISEIQDTDIRKVAENSSKDAAEKLKTPVIKEDVGFQIDALNGFPGPFSKFINDWLEPQKILKMLENEKNRKARFVDVIAYCNPDKETVSFITITEGTIADEQSGENGWGIDKIFIPEGSQVTLACLSDSERRNVWKNSHWEKLAKYLIGRK